MTIDVIIPTRDRPAQLASTLAALARQDVTGFGIVVVDDGGVTAAQTQVPPSLTDMLSVRFLRNEKSIGPGPSRNRGADESDARFVVFLDDDCLAVPGLIGRHRMVLEGSGDAVVSLGPILAPAGQRLSVWNHWDADRLEREYARLREGPSARWTHLYTGNVGLRRDDFLAVGGFDIRFARQEDVELGYRLDRHGCRFEFDSEATVFHDSNRSLRTWIGIPRASANFDVLMDRLDPDSERLASVVADLAEKHWALRLARRIAQTSGSQRWVVQAAVATGRLLHRLHADRAALAAFSVVWDLTYCEALNGALAAGDRVGCAT